VFNLSYHIEQEIASQPHIIQYFLANQAENAATIVRAIRDYDPKFVVIAARGSSDHAAQYAKYLFGIQCRLPVALAIPSAHTLYHVSPNFSGALVIGISQSGHSEDICQVLADARAQGALTLAITNNEISPLSQICEHHLNLDCGEERSVAATKTYTTELAAIALLTTTLLDRADYRDLLLTLPSQVLDSLTQADSISDWVQRYRYATRIASIGRGYNYCTALEISLKIKELCYMPAEEYSEADFRHGPIAVVNQGFPVIVIAPQGNAIRHMVDLLDQLREREAECIVISNHETALARATRAIHIPSSIPEWLSPICTVIPGQIFAAHLAIAKGHDVDTPRGLRKVTVTT
jgi:glucosamine--fructose-6-phosphate aminotransferase (isomerizing)